MRRSGSSSAWTTPMPSLSVRDLLRAGSSTRSCGGFSREGRTRCLGREDHPRRRYPGAAPESCTSPAPFSPVTRPASSASALRVSIAMRSGMLAAWPRTAVDTVSPGATAWEPGALEPYDAAIRDLRLQGSAAGSQHAAGLREGPRAWIDHRRAGNGVLRQGAEEEPEARGDAEAPVSDSKERQYPAPDRVLTFDKLSERLPVRERDPRRRARPRPGDAEAGTARARGGVGAHVPGPGVRGDRRRRGGRYGHRRGDRLELRPVWCDHRKGGRLTPPEGGDGPRVRADVGSG